MTTQDSASGALTHFIDKFKAAVGDAITLDILTISGTIQATIFNEAGNVDPTKFFANLRQKIVEPGSSVRIVAFSHKELDGDVTEFVTTDAEPALLTAHRELFEAAVKSRLDFLHFLADLARSIVK